MYWLQTVNIDHFAEGPTYTLSSLPSLTVCFRVWDWQNRQNVWNGCNWAFPNGMGTQIVFALKNKTESNHSPGSILTRQEVWIYWQTWRYSNIFNAGCQLKILQAVEEENGDQTEITWQKGFNQSVCMLFGLGKASRILRSIMDVIPSKAVGTSAKSDPVTISSSQNYFQNTLDKYIKYRVYFQTPKIR